MASATYGSDDGGEAGFTHVGNGFDCVGTEAESKLGLEPLVDKTFAERCSLPFFP